MTNTISVEAWLDVIEREYLATYIRDGGVAVKFAVIGAEKRPELRRFLKPRCEKLDYQFVKLDAEACRVHMPQDLFFSMASQLDWRLLARRVILRLLSEKHYRIEDIDPETPGNVIEAIARSNALDMQFVITELRPLLQNRVSRNSRMAKAFRVAMTHLCLKEMETAEPEKYAGQPLLNWITGIDTRMTNVRPFQVFTPINRATARLFIESALYWVRKAGFSGTVMVLDNARVMIARNPRDGKRYYTRAMAMDHYEVLREFIDDTDQLSGSLLLVATDESFVDGDSTRGWGIYAALRTRIMDDVRDKNAVNPVSALVRLS